MKLTKLAILAAALAATPFAAHAQDVGATVYGNDGKPIGTVDSNDGTNAVIAVGEFKAPLPPDFEDALLRLRRSQSHT